MSTYGVCRHSFVCEAAASPRFKALSIQDRRSVRRTHFDESTIVSESGPAAPAGVESFVETSIGPCQLMAVFGENGMGLVFEPREGLRFIARSRLRSTSWG